MIVMQRNIIVSRASVKMVAIWKMDLNYIAPKCAEVISALPNVT